MSTLHLLMKRLHFMIILDGVGHSADQGVEPRSRQHAETDADLRRKGAARGAKTHPRTTIRVGISGPDQVCSAEGHHGRHANGTRPCRFIGPDWNPAELNLRRGSILQARQNVQRIHQEKHTAHRVARETIVRSRSTLSNRAQVRSSTAHSHGSRATSVPGDLVKT